MADAFIPDDVRDFILRRIDSIAQIETLLLIRSDPRSNWTAARLAHRLYIDEAQATEALDGLRASELLIGVDGNYSLDGIRSETLALIDKLLESYTRQLIPVTNIVHSKPRRIGSFADAFKFRKGS